MTAVQSNIHETDVAIIGAGPVGLFAVFQLGMLGIRAHVIDALPESGGQCAALYPEKPIYDIPGFVSINGEDLIKNLCAQAAPFAPVYHLGQQVVALDKAASGWQLTTDKGTTIRARAVIIAAGCGAFGPNRPPLAGIASYEGTSVHYLVTQREQFRDKTLVIAGGGDSAVDWANSLGELAKKIYVVHRRDKFRAMPESVARMKALEAQGKIEMVIPYQLDALQGDGKQLRAVEVATLEGEKRTLAADHLLAFFGLSMDLGPIANWGLNLHLNHIRVNPTTAETNTPGIFAIGDIATYEHKLKLILCGFSEAALAAHAIYRIIHPDKALHFEYSTSKGVPGAAA
ncbi:MAG: NAD(P)/FAD-dependent oxidoreductase [Alphaproteobacteria bacterium]|jgi:thioredoxin reductase (NADPH)